MFTGVLLNLRKTRIDILAEVHHMSLSVPDWVGYPQRDWQAITPREAGLDADKWAGFLVLQRRVIGLKYVVWWV